MMRPGSKNRDPFFGLLRDRGAGTAYGPSAVGVAFLQSNKAQTATNVIVDRVIMISLISASPRLSANSC